VLFEFLDSQNLFSFVIFSFMKQFLILILVLFSATIFTQTDKPIGAIWNNTAEHCDWCPYCGMKEIVYTKDAVLLGETCEYFEGTQ